MTWWGVLPVHLAPRSGVPFTDGWPAATETLLHEMVHQWQAETGRPLDHGRAFRAKARSVGIRPNATVPAGYIASLDTTGIIA